MINDLLFLKRKHVRKEEHQDRVVQLKNENHVSFPRNPALQLFLGTTFLEVTASGVRMALALVTTKTGVNRKIGWKVKASITLKPVWKVNCHKNHFST